MSYDKDKCWFCLGDTNDPHPCPGTVAMSNGHFVTANDLEAISEFGFRRWHGNRTQLEAMLTRVLGRMARAGDTLLVIRLPEDRQMVVKQICDAIEQETNASLGRKLHEEREAKKQAGGKLEDS